MNKAKELKDYLAEHKRCNVYSMKDVKAFSGVSDEFRFYVNDLKGCLYVLEELVLEAKCDKEMAKLTTIEKFAKKNGKIRDILRETNKYQQNVLSRYKFMSLKNLPKSAAIKTDIKKLQELKNDIDDDLKKRDKKDNSRPKILKLSKQIDEELKAGNEYLNHIKKIPKEYREADTLYDKMVSAMLKKQPQMSANTKKFNKLLENQLEAKKLHKSVNSHIEERNKVVLAGNAARTAAEKKDKNNMAKQIQSGEKILKKLNKSAKEFKKIQKEFKSKIAKAEAKEKKRIEKALKDIGKAWKEADEYWVEVKAECTKSLSG